VSAESTRNDLIPLGWRVRAVAAVSFIPPLLEVVSLPRFDSILTSASRRQMRSVPDDVVAARWVDAALLGLPGPWSRTCLRRAAVLYYLMRSSGRVPALCIGVRRDEPDALRSHAWVELDGEVYLEPESTRDMIPGYKVIARLPLRTLTA
jgi:hypothetical protein